MSIIRVLSQQSNRILRVIGVQFRHIEIINKIYHIDFSRRTKLSTRFFLQSLLQLTLQIRGVRIIIEVNQLIGVTIWFLSHNFLQNTLSKLRFSAPRAAD